MKKTINVLLLVFLSSAPVAHAAGYKIVVNKDNTASALSKDEIAAMMMKKTSTWRDGTPVVPVDQPSASKVRVAFSVEILGRSTDAVKSFWRQQIYAGRATPPPEHATDDLVLKFVRRYRGAIGYVAESTHTDGVKVIDVD